MLDGPRGSAPDPYVFYKLHHVERARRAWALSEDLGFYEALRSGPLTVEQICAGTGLQERPVRVLLWANAWLGIVGQADGRYFIYDIMREFVLDGGRARNRPRPCTFHSRFLEVGSVVGILPANSSGVPIRPRCCEPPGGDLRP
ncbi:MAG: hypothetical protein AB1505_16570, partial [Candidatus Latescibacterota bacterium]